ncbi:MAG TPA: sugar phosphate nucleotidyltransferase [Anaerolineaceae bacterium]
MQNNFYAVIMAGGEGSRLWPLSRQSRPKQMVSLGSDRTLFQTAVDRLGQAIPPERTFVVTVASQAAGLQQLSPQIPIQNYLLEPMPRGTASVVGFAAAVLRKRDPQAVMAIVTADHLIQNEAYFQRLLANAYTLASDGYLVTLGIRPTFPATGYGYIQRGERLEGYDFLGYQVKHFKEKPDEDTARNFLETGDHDWNSGMFVWRVDRIWEEFQKLMPELAEKLDAISAAWDTPAQQETLNNAWPTLKPQTIDYGIMEHADRVVVLPAVDLGWNDVGSWESMYEVFAPDERGNIILNAEHLGIDTAGTLVVSDHTQRLIVTLGLDDLIVVDTQDAVLVCSRKYAQKVKEVVNLLKKKEEARRYL